MKKTLLSVFMAATAFAASASGDAQRFTENFQDSTLRVDYIFGGGAGKPVQVLLDRQSKSAGWAGRRTNLHALPYERNGTITVVDAVSRDTLYTNSFSSLFQEWLSTEEADSVARGYENTFLVPLPKREADIILLLRDNRHQPMASLTHRYSPKDELVMRKGQNPLPSVYLHKGAEPEKAIDVAILAEGYTPEEMDSFINHARMITDEILSYTPYKENKEKFNFIAVMSPSKDSGVTIPLKEDWKDTAFGSHFSTFHSARYLTTPNLKSVHDALSGIPYEHIVILVNTDNYGGGGIFNSYLMSAAKNKFVLPVSVHEFGHSFGGLADEYFYANEEGEDYPLDVEPWAPNITTLVDFSSKWEDMMPKKDEKSEVGLFEGGGYRSKGIYRPVETCRMRDNYHPTFCPVCERALQNLIDFYTKED
ncbi:MAG: IgA Peptidase M64 [Muribaculaceae bacterium]|nr:IgA Peptidase M64 [Muribaculaceae bacterium]